MAAVTRLCCVLRLSFEGVGALRTLGGAVYFSHLARPSPTHYAPVTVALQQIRHGSFFNKLTADELWRGVSAETGAGARKGRGKRAKRKVKKDLNKGQSLGEGRAGYLWPGLNTPIFKDGSIQKPMQRGEAEQKEMTAALERQRDEWEKRRKAKIKKERGWTGGSWGGVSLGPLDPGPNGETYEDFDSRVIELKSVFTVTPKESRKRSISALVAVGNGNGVAGFALGKAADRTAALRKAKNRAMNYLYYIERYNDYTIYHDIESKYKKTTLRMKKQNKGYGLRCHRAVITLCKLIGIKDMYAKVDGSVNLLNITRALFQGLASQETHQTLADKKQLNVVEFRAEQGPLPIVVARPQLGARQDPEVEDEVPNTRLHWADVKALQGVKKSIWAGVKRTIS
ncbi:small ribosomal subunit protein uS5m precursor [Danio rerio]|uniref:Small ribosomal subunit protein uS5m n=1 Tax=Danio rerio TaxID=7955 RepID=Q08C39_DANRE|nr:28S ribosomal protein S5, mitochondrial precursor [Danio rerio]AAI24423.1 Zgc:153680 [Danio rerio]|eukprot:NP_001070064.1 28S ribosomal protein S5, mitochondrial precursor [Danio rerio]